MRAQWVAELSVFESRTQLLEVHQNYRYKSRKRQGLVTNRNEHLYRVSQEECVRLREGVPYVKVYRYNPKHLCPKLNGYGDNGHRKVWSSGGSTHCTCQLTSLIDVCPWVWCPMTESELTLAVQLCSRLIPECAVSHITSVLAMHVSCIVLGTLRTTMTCVRVFFSSI